MNIEITTDPTPEDLEAISLGLQSFNAEYIGSVAAEIDCKFAVFARSEEGEVVGGIRAVAFWDWLYIELLWVSKKHRHGGIGKQLLDSAEEFALKNHFHRSRIETTSFQALEFYQRQGYEIYCELEDLPPGHTTFYMKKAL